MRVAVAGASGLIGTALCRHLLQCGHEVTRLVRRPPTVGESRWDPGTGTIDASAIDRADAVVNLAGAGIGDHRWTASYRQTLRASRIDSTALLARTIAATERRPRVLLSGSAVGIYGSSASATFTEDSATGAGFLPDLCRDWEAAAAPAADAGARVAFLRSGLVLSPHGGVLPKLLLPIKLFAGGPYGHGKQWQSWVSLDDEVRAITHLLMADVEGPANITSPNPVSNRELVGAIAGVIGRPAWLRAPQLPLRLALGTDRADSLLFEGQRVIPAVLTGDGFEFTDTELEPTLRRLLGT